MVRVGRLTAMRHNVREISLQELTKRDMKQARFEGETMESVEIEIRNQEAKCRSYEISLESARKKNTDMSLYLKKIADIMKKISQLKNMSLNKAEQQVDKRLERQTQIKILSGADIIATTLGSCSLTLVNEVFGRGSGDGQTKFTCCILDEATQCCEPEGLLPLILGIEKLILVGDPEQLPATVVSKEAHNYGYGQSLFTRIWNKFLNDPGSPIQFLNVQHRMDPEICLWPSQYFYNNSLITSQFRPAKHVPLKPYVVLSEEFTQTAYNEIVNQNEAKLVCLIAIGIYELVDKNTSISIITPYSKQRSEILKYMTEDRTVPSNWSITVNTIDSFQGQECDIVIMSCARTEGVGFLTDTQRLCVALTRARCSLIICGNFVSLSRDLMWHELLENASQRGLLFKLNCSRLPRKEDALKYIIR